MPVFLKHRRTDLVEFMDRPDCDLQQLENTYQHFATINKYFSGWKWIYRKRIRPLMTDPDRTYTLLDIGFGGGDIPLKISEWSKKDGIKLEILAIELDERAIEFARKLDAPANVTFKKMHSKKLLEKGGAFDFVLSNHVMHHLSNSELLELMDQASKLAKRRVLFSDIERNTIGYGLFKFITPLLFRNSFIPYDGLISIRRSYTFEELRAIIPKKWKLDQMPLFRLLLTLDKT
jgi:2-polyprenyl-3-methyl-5-hydroxy-6-metoxy-1,4-benzoquinol methylase